MRVTEEIVLIFCFDFDSYFANKKVFLTPYANGA